MRRFRIELRELLIIIGMIFVVALILGGSYMGAGIMLKADLPFVRDFVEPHVIPPASYDAFLIADTWSTPKNYMELEYVPRFTDEETEEEFFERMADLDRRSIYDLVREYPELIEDRGWSYIEFDALADVPSSLLSEERNASLKEALLGGAVKTVQGHPVIAINGLHSIMLLDVNINQTQGYMAIGYDKKKLVQSITSEAYDGWWHTMSEFLAENKDATVAIPANDHTYNSRMGYGIVSGGFSENRIPRYKASSLLSLHMGFKDDGTFYVGEGTRFGMDNFSEGQGLLLIHGAPPVVEVVPDYEQVQILDHLAVFIDSYVAKSHEEGSIIPPIDINAEDFDSLPLILAYIESFEDYELQARYSWVIRENVIRNALEDVSFTEERMEQLQGFYSQFEVTINRVLQEVTSAGFDAEGNEITLVENMTVSAEILMPDLTDVEVPAHLILSDNEREVIRMILLCNSLGALTYEDETIQVRTAATAIAQRHSDGATFLFGIGGEKTFDVRELPGIGVTFNEMQDLFLLYSATNAAVTTSGDRVGFGWKDRNLLKVKDTTLDGGRSYGVYILK